MIGVQKNSMLPVITKKAKSKYFLSHFSPDITPEDIQKSLEEQLKLSFTICTRLKTKFNTYASLHTSTNRKNFLPVNKTGV
jgi:hypothetical protein